MKNNKGFTLIELLAVIVILGLISGIGVFAYTRIVKDSEERVYMAYEDTMYAETLELLSKKVELIPTNGQTKKFTLTDIKIEPINNPRKKSDLCPTSYVNVTRNDINGTNAFTYYVCLICDNYNHDGSKCKTYPKETEHFDQQSEKEFLVDFPSCPNKYYTGATQVLFAAHSSGKYTNSQLSGKNVSTYTVTLKPTGKYIWSDNGSNAARTLTCRIVKKTTSVNAPSSITLTYPNTYSTTISAESGGTLSCSGNTLATCSISSNRLTVSPRAYSTDTTMPIYIYVGETDYYNSRSYPITINYRRATITCPSSSNYVKTYTGNTISSGYSCPGNSTTSSGATGVNVGNYNHVCKANTGYKFNTGDTCARSWRIQAATLTCPSGGTSIKYTGSTVSSGISCPSHSTLSSGGTGKNIGSYSQKCTAQTGYQFSSGSTCSISWSIRSASCSYTCNCTCANGTTTASGSMSGAYTCSNMSSTCSSRCSSACSSKGGLKSTSLKTCSCT